MVRGDTEVTKVHYKGTSDDYIVIVESPEAVRKWKEDSSTPLVDVVSAFKIFTTDKHGSQGTLNGASKSQLDGEFGTSNEEDVIKKILHEGQIQESKNNARGGDRNISQGGTVAH